MKDIIMSNAQQAVIFANIHSQLKTIEFKETWKNSTGYLDFACYEIVDKGIYAFTDDYGRRGIMFSFEEGINAVIFERYKTVKDHSNFVLVRNLPIKNKETLEYLLDADRIQSGSIQALVKACGCDDQGRIIDWVLNAVEIFNTIKN